MRLIDADECLDFLKTNCSEDMYLAVRAILDPCKTVEERKQGEWIIDDKEGSRIWHCHCSNCKKDPQDYIGGSENWWLIKLPSFCPNCSADMRGSEDESIRL